ncbi:hypothetical protein FNF29_04053 [Cafeteria roenbergensis]|uniref:Mitochondrial 2-oxoglutarate/malate carrier protein n=1 Tax=Cafeteria roenbergensis TaxID=33653 RepID=A0A5A8CHS9_CAFRO|nr:hypothetical protein FNF29_04053 [Cafeteria roenbergensis]|eukprot:KAA0152187.1 hypothetical protein FNF29_04053 [Cafeteria roenbergensis]
MAAKPSPAQPAKSTSGLAQALQPYVTGGSAAITASCVIHPIDLTKVRLQLVGESLAAGATRPSAVAVVSKIVAEEGFAGLYSGLSAAVMRQAVYGTARLGLHREFSNYLKKQRGGEATLPVHLSVAASMSSGAIASLIGNPFDVSLVRMQADTMRPKAERRGYTSVFNALSRIVKDEGIARLWRGCLPNVLRAMAMNVGMMASYDQAKGFFNKTVGPGVTANLLSAGAAGFMCAFLSLPFDLIKTRLQSMRIDPATGKMPYTGVLDCAAQVARKEGPLAFWTGFGAFYGRSAPHAMIILLTMEQFNTMYSSVFNTTTR